jgi:hypothetical protein
MNILMNIWLIIFNKKYEIIIFTLQSLSLFALSNSFLWAFTIPKILYDEINNNYRFTQDIYITYQRNTLILSLLIIVILLYSINFYLIRFLCKP